jgi:hypothetical protein
MTTDIMPSNKSLLISHKYRPLLCGKAGVDGDCLPVLVEPLFEGEGVGLHQQTLEYLYFMFTFSKC